MTELNLIELEDTNGGLHTAAKVASVIVAGVTIASLPATWPGYVVAGAAGAVGYVTGASLID